MSETHPTTPAGSTSAAKQTPGQRLSATIEAVHDRGEGVFMPFVVIGDPDLETSMAAVDALVAGGADVLEFGFPFSDPPADGPVIQAADLRALAAGVTPSDCLRFLAEVKRRHDVPVVLLIYYNLILQRGLDRFCAEAEAAGVDAVLAADVPLEELTPLETAAAAHGVANVLIASALTSAERLAQIRARCGGFLYTVARVGITGEQRAVSSSLSTVLDRLRAPDPSGRPRLPALVGFGISTPAHVSAAMAAGADGVICGSAIVRRIAEHCPAGSPPTADRVAAMQRSLTDFVAAMKAATQGAWRPPPQASTNRHVQP